MTAPRYENLLGVPSYHFVPLFAQRVREAFEEFDPSVVALEAVPSLEPSFAHALSCWPTPVLADLAWGCVPFLPGDSIVEAYRLAVERGVPVRCVDLPVLREKRRPWLPLPGAEVAAQVDASSMVEAVDAVHGRHPALATDLAREAAMARSLRSLMDEHPRVLWVGGMAHWTRIVRRLEANDFDGPEVRLREPARPSHFRLTGAALFELTDRTPYEVARYALDPERYDPADALRVLAVESCQRDGGDDGEFEVDDEETQSPADLARVFTYARNLSAASGVHALPSVTTLLQSAHACVGERYAARMFVRVFEEPPPTAGAAELPSMDLVPGPSGEEYRSRAVRYDLRPCWPASRSAQRLRWTLDQARRIAEGRQRFHLNEDQDDEGDGKEKKNWTVLTSYEQQYRAYVDSLLRIASRRLTAESQSAKFASGIGDGIDVKETVRRWQSGDVYVRSVQDGGLRVTSFVVDYSSLAEGSDVHLSRGPDHQQDGWIDPSWDIVGSVSRTSGRTILQRRPIRVQRNKRDLSFVTTDLKTSTKFKPQFDLYTEVILKLLRLEGDADTLYGWMDVWSHFCRGKPLAYFSHYRPSARLYGIAHRHGVRLVHVPLAEVPPKMLKAHAHFYFLQMNRKQWYRFHALHGQDQEAFLRTAE